MGLSRAKVVFNEAVAGGQTATETVTVEDMESMLVLWYVPDSDAVGDIGATTVRTYTPYDDGDPDTDTAPTLITLPIPGTAVAAATRNAPQASKWDRYDVRGLERVHLSFVNGNVGSKTLQIAVYLYTT